MHIFRSQMLLAIQQWIKPLLKDSLSDLLSALHKHIIIKMNFLAAKHVTLYHSCYVMKSQVSDKFSEIKKREITHSYSLISMLMS